MSEDVEWVTCRNDGDTTVKIEWREESGMKRSVTLLTGQSADVPYDSFVYASRFASLVILVP